MKKVGFIGVYDKIDMILNIAKIFTTMSKKVLVVDSTLNQKAKYIVPTISPTVSYITSFEDIDIAVGFKNLEEIKMYIGITNTEIPYDIVLIDADTTERVNEFRLDQAETNYFVTSFDIYSLKRGMEIISNLTTPLELTKILYAKDMLKEEDDYLNFLSLGCKVTWKEDRIYFPIENGDLSVISENQRVQKIKFKKLSTQYKESLIFIAEQILKDRTDSNIRRAVRTIEKGV